MKWVRNVEGRVYVERVPVHSRERTLLPSHGRERDCVRVTLLLFSFKEWYRPGRVVVMWKPRGRGGVGQQGDRKGVKRPIGGGRRRGLQSTGVHTE